MSAWSTMIERVKAVLFKSRLDRELEEELRFHIARETEVRARAGSSEPRREALAAFGGVERFKDEVREARGTLPLEELVADVRYAFRSLGRNLGFTSAVVGVLGLAIGAATAVFTVVDRVLLADLPYPNAGQLVRVFQRSGPSGGLNSLSTVEVQAIEEQQHSFDGFGAIRYRGASLSGAGSPERLAAGFVTSGFLKALGVRTVAGRLIEPRDDIPGAPRTVVLSTSFAERAFGGVAAAVDKTVAIDGITHTVVGVLEPGRDDIAGIPAQIWPVLQLEKPDRRGPFGIRAVGRLKEGVTIEQAARDLGEISVRIFPIWAAGYQDSSSRLTPIPLREAMVGSAGQQVGLFAGAVGLVLLLAIANVATLMLVRASARQHELSVRTALGAGQHRLGRLILTECLALTILAGATGLGLAWLGLGIVEQAAPNLPRLAEVALDAKGVGFAVVIAVVSGLLVSLAPLMSGTVGRSSTASTLVSSSPRAGTGRRTNAIRGALVATEFALALPLLLGAGLLFNSFLRLQGVDTGFEPQGVYGLSVALAPVRYREAPAIQAFWRRLEDRVAAVPGITAVGLGGSVPPDNFGDVNNFDLLDKPVPAGTSQPVSPWPTVTPGFFTALGLSLLEGRSFVASDTGSAAPVVVVSRAWARKYYPDESALGKRMIQGGCTTCAYPTVIGVIGDVQYQGLAGNADAVYVPLSQSADLSLNLLVRSKLSQPATFKALRDIVGSLDPELAPIELVMTEVLSEALGDPRRWTAVVGSFAAVGVLLAALGIFGLMSYVVRQRQREIGVRMALGAAPGSVTTLVVRRGMRYALLGTAVGLAISAFESRWVGSLLFGVEPNDPGTIAIAVAVLILIGVVACWVPGLRASRINPLDVLRSD